MAKIANLQEVAVNELKPYERNAKIHGKAQIEKLKASIEAFGFLTPCLIDREKNLIAGHGRIMAAKELGIKKVPCVLVEDLTEEERRAYILDGSRLVICQSNANMEKLKKEYHTDEVNPIGDWTGGPGVDTGATNRKLGSDMAGSVTGGGLHGKDLSKADVAVNIYSFLKAQRTGKTVEMTCAIGDEYVDDVPYERIVEIAREHIRKVGGFEKFAEWGLV